MTTRDIAIERLLARAMDKGDQRSLHPMTKRVAVSLRDYRKRDVMRGTEGPGQYNVWEIAR